MQRRNVSRSPKMKESERNEECGALRVRSFRLIHFGPRNRNLFSPNRERERRRERNDSMMKYFSLLIFLLSFGNEINKSKGPEEADEEQMEKWKADEKRRRAVKHFPEIYLNGLSCDISSTRPMRNIWNDLACACVPSEMSERIRYLRISVFRRKWNRLMVIFWAMSIVNVNNVSDNILAAIPHLSFRLTSVACAASTRPFSPLFRPRLIDFACSRRSPLYFNYRSSRNDTIKYWVVWNGTIKEQNYLSLLTIVAPAPFSANISQ